MGPWGSFFIINKPKPGSDSSSWLGPNKTCTLVSYWGHNLAIQIHKCELLYFVLQFLTFFVNFMKFFHKKINNFLEHTNYFQYYWEKLLVISRELETTWIIIQKSSGHLFHQFCINKPQPEVVLCSTHRISQLCNNIQECQDQVK